MIKFTEILKQFTIIINIIFIFLIFIRQLKLAAAYI